MAELRPEEFDLVLTLGDISPASLDYIKLMAGNIPTFSIYGNHDPETIPGLQSIDGEVLHIRGWRIAGISGCGLNYRDGHSHKPPVHVYSERRVEAKLRAIGTVDILITHAPPWCVSQDEDLTHQGFKAIDLYMEKYKPSYVVHGHLHKRYRRRVGATEVIGIYEKDYLKLKGAGER